MAYVDDLKHFVKQSKTVIESESADIEFHNIEVKHLENSIRLLKDRSTLSWERINMAKATIAEYETLIEKES